MVSIIVPFFNAEKHIVRCITSILLQSYEDFELILVDDKSSDRGGEIVKEYAEKDSRVRLIQLEKNSGVSNARNIGLSNSTGEYITFVDSDDWLDHTFLEVMLSKLTETNADLVCCGHRNKTEQKEDVWSICDIDSVVTSREAIIGLFQNKMVQPVVWAKIYRTEIINKNLLRFDKDIYMSEDIKFVFEYLSLCASCCLVHSYLYWYVIDNPDSAMNSGKAKTIFKEKWLTAWTAYMRMRAFADLKFQSDPKVRQAVLCSQTNTARMKLHMILEHSYQNRTVYHELVTFIRRHAFRFVKYDYSKPSRKLMIGLCAISPKIEFIVWKLIRSGE